MLSLISQKVNGGDLAKPVLWIALLSLTALPLIWLRSPTCRDADVTKKIAAQMQTYFSKNPVVVDASETARVLSEYLRDVSSKVEIISITEEREASGALVCDLIGHLALDRVNAKVIARSAVESPALGPRLDTREGRAKFGEFLKLITGGFSGRAVYRVSEDDNGKAVIEILSVERYSR